MKKILAVVLALVLCMALCAVGSAADKYKVGILAPAVTHGWVAGVAYNAEQECLALADEVDYKLYTSNNAEEMTTQLDDLMTWGAQAIVAFPQWEGMEVPIQNAIDAGITVVNFDIVIDADGVYRVTGDNEGMGVESAKYIVEKIGTTGTVVALPVPTSGSVSELRMKGFTDTIKEIAPEMNVIEYATAVTRSACPSRAKLTEILVEKALKVMPPNARVLVKKTLEHSQYSAACVQEVYAFADHVVKREQPFFNIEKQPTKEEPVLRLDLPKGVSVKKAELLYSESDTATNWKSLPLEGGAEISFEVPSAAKYFFVNVTDSNGFSCSSALQTM